MNPNESAYLEEARQHYLTRLKYHETLSALRSLMAVINRDGGHRAETFCSDVEAAEDCQDTVRKMFDVK